MGIKIDKKWLVGFVDGEGCFFVGINKNKTMSLGEQVIPEFRIVQHNRDIELLIEIQKFFNCGMVTHNRGINNPSHIMEFRVRNLCDLANVIVPFFTENQLITVKSQSFNYFSQIINLMIKKKHLTVEGLKEIKKLKSKMNL